jgi:pimeloyl-ACP methyl ester carboxylesterase
MTTADSTVYLPRREARHEDLTLRGLRHRVTWWGERTSSPIVLLHGFMDCGATWQFLADCLPPSWSLAALDWRGFGHSDRAPGGYWFPDYFADLEALLDALVPGERARVIGHSMGANVAQVYAGIRPQRLEWLVNLEGLGLAPLSPQQAPARLAQWLDELGQHVQERRYRSVSELAFYLRARNPRLSRERADFIARAWTRPVRVAGKQGSEADPSAAEVELLFDPRHRHVNPILYRREEARACWAAVEAPVLLVTGDASDPASRIGACTEEMRDDIRHLRSVVIGGVGHMMHHENPAAVARHIVEFEGAHATRRQPSAPD